MSREEPPGGPPELELEPKLKVRRLNRLAVLLVAGVGIVVLWAAYFVLSTRRPIGSALENRKQPALEADPAEIDELERRARARPEETGGRFPWLSPSPDRPRFELPPPEPPRDSTGPSDAALRLERAYAAPVLVAEFGRGALTSGAGPAWDPVSALAAAQELMGRPGEEGIEGGEGGAGVPPAAGLAPEESPRPDRMEEFLRPRPATDRPVTLDASIVPPRSRYVIQEGTLIPAILTAGIHSDLPGRTRALVRQNVYDSATGRYLLVPQGARLLGRYDHRVAWGQKRVLFAWHRLIFPDGRSLDLGSMPGADLAAMAGIRDRVNNHFVRTFGSALLLSAVSAGVQLSQPQESSQGNAPSARQVAAAALGQELGRATAEVTRKNLNLQPTLEIRPGVLFHVEVTADVAFTGRYRPEALPGSR